MRLKVSVLMAVYNGEKYLREAIDSILSQTFTDFEFIIVDDGSTDASVEIINTYLDRRIRLVRNDRNLGLAVSLNKGLDIALGEYVARMDCDDISLPVRLATQVAYMDAHPEVGACGTWAIDIDATGKEIRERKTPVGKQLENRYWIPSPIIHPSAMIRFAELTDLRYDSEIRYAQDYDFWLRIRARYQLSNLSKYLLLYRVHNESVSMRYTVGQTRMAYDIFCKYVAKRKIPYDTFLALIFYSDKVNPLRRVWATMKLAKAIHKPYSSFHRDNIDYTRSWLQGKHDLYKAALFRTYVFRAAFKAFRIVRQRIIF